VFTSVASSAVLIALYVAFLFIEQEVFPQKITNLFPRAKSKELVIHVFQRITHDIQAYLGLKTLLGLTTSLLSWLIMRYVGLDFSDFWALLIFLLNYIPNIGAIIATFFPAMLALIQFSEPWTAGMVILGLVLIQFVMGNIVEPRFLSRSLNLSALVILMALALWGAIWGVLGMFLSVPITVMMMIIFSQFSATRPIAILLSQNGSIQQMEDDAR
jgi:AI-2 transport protein TqsA